MNINYFLMFLPFKLRVYLKFFYRNKYFPNLTTPKTFNEKITKRKLFDENPLFVLCADKYTVRSYVQNKIGKSYLIPLLDACSHLTPEKLKGFEIPFVVKCTHNSGGIVLVDTLDCLTDVFISSAVHKINSELKKDYGKLYDENWYSKIEPRIIVERMLRNKNGQLPEDFKFHVFRCHSSVKVIIQVDFDRFSNHNRTFYTLDKKILPYVNKYPNYYRDFPEIINFDEMIEVALKLSSDFDYCRVDLYNVDGRIYFGELTFCHGGGLDYFSDKNEDLEWGSFWIQ